MGFWCLVGCRVVRWPGGLGVLALFSGCATYFKIVGFGFLGLVGGLLILGVAWVVGSKLMTCFCVLDGFWWLVAVWLILVVLAAGWISLLATFLVGLV